MKTIAKWITRKLVEFILAIYENRPEGERLNEQDIENIREARELKRRARR